MTWQSLLIVFLGLSTVVGLLQRRLGQAIPQYNRLVNGVFFVGVHYPIGLITAAAVGFHWRVGWADVLIMLAAGASFPITNLLIFRASKDVDASLFGILQNFQPVVTIGLAIVLLSEQLNPQQLGGTLVIIASVLAVSLISYNRGNRGTRTGLMLALIAVVLAGLGTVYEAWMVHRLGYGTYIVYGLGSQTFWMAVFAWPQRHQLAEVINRRYGPSVLALSLSKSLKGLAFVGALYLSRSAALVSAFTSCLPLLLVLAGYWFLGEKQYLKLKIAAALAGAAGLAVLGLSR